ncbi:hypothetical protein BSL78_16816 [Apostichopus japonicus]|uniref:Endonuclease/exonuclease/phosphatase domain-containing protein n=1 Tax=Stichopus japonicus TaxID=307972 RepID=A0A2G8KE90_STIJA|nr:hypothetical protein BSL78_16816 [Apostichopus japonicus]
MTNRKIQTENKNCQFTPPAHVLKCYLCKQSIINYWFNEAKWNESKPKRKRGRRGGKLVKLRRRQYNAPVLRVILANVQSLYNKTGELFSRIANLRDYSDCNVFCLTETWLTSDHPDCILQPPGFTIYRHDRDRQITGKSQGGGVCFLINKKWCTDVRVISQATTPDMEHIMIKCRPFYLPQDFSSVTLTAVYIHPRADTNIAVEGLREIISICENSDPNTLSIVAGDFNQVNLRSSMPEFKQYVTCPTRENKTLDHCYCKVKNVYKSISQASIGNSDHSTILLIPVYKQRFKQQKPVKRTIKVWSQETTEELQDCFADTDWDLFNEDNDLHSFTDTVTAYINFCHDVCIPTKTVTQYPNNKPWCDKVIKAKIKAKDEAYRTKTTDPDLYHRAKSDLRKAQREPRRIALSKSFRPLTRERYGPTSRQLLNIKG